MGALIAQLKGWLFRLGIKLSRCALMLACRVIWYT